MEAQTILIIRHAEKPRRGGDGGIDSSGSPDRTSLTPRGWQRAGVWTELFAPSLGQPSSLPTPTAIFASAPATHAEILAGDEGSKSRPRIETVTGIAAKVGIPIDQRFTKRKEADLANVISTVQGVVLVCWQHDGITTIATALSSCALVIPDDWPGDRFNVIFRFDRPNSSSSWTFRQLAPIMLTGDIAEPIGSKR